MDPLSDVLQTVELTGMIFLRGEFGGRYGVSMPPPTLSHPAIRPQTADHRLIMFHIVEEGGGCLEVDGFGPQQLEQGDLVVVLDDLHHSLVDTPGRATVPSSDLVILSSEGCAPPTVKLGDGKCSMRIVCGMLQFVARGFNPVFAALPPYLHVPASQDSSTMLVQGSLARIIQEVAIGRPGSETLLGRLAELLFLETLRSYLERTSPDTQGGWFAALKEPAVGHAVTLIHQAPGRRWSVAELARSVGVSRSVLSARFSELLQMPPMTYVTRWRIRVASQLMGNPKLTLATIAEHVGYESESAFSRAFKREMGQPPGTWRRRNRS